jgi:tyrosyl-tRNA synthetase
VAVPAHLFFVNTADTDAGRFLRLFTFLPLGDVAGIEEAHRADAGRRAAQRALAREVTALVHGSAAAAEAAAAAESLFTGDVRCLPLPLLLEALHGVPATTHSLADLRAGPLPVADVLVAVGVCSSKREARDLLTAGAVSLNGLQARAGDTFSESSLLHGRVAAFRRGKQSWYLGLWQ